MKPLLVTTAAAGLTAATVLANERAARRIAERLAAAALETLLNAIDATDAQTGAHVRRVAVYALTLADAAGFDRATTLTIERAAIFHDIGKLHEALFDIMHDSAELTPAQRRAVLTHPQRGADVLAPLKSFFPELGRAVLSHHERWDGSGYPRGIKGRRIPVAARVIALADTFDAITYKRRYRSGRSADHAATAIAEGRGTQFDPDLTDLMLSPPVWERIIEAHRTMHAPRVRRAVITEHAPSDLTFRWRSKTIDPASRVPRLAPAVSRR
jgi:HD-GYP domain-containing protein (c-di-GMP phosphodiesterase class II)